MEKIEARLSMLSSTNYQRWKFDLSALLESKGLIDYVNGVSVKPENNENDELSTWRMNDAKAKSLISITLDDEHHGLIRSCVTSKEMWDTIVNHREQSTSTNKLLCHQLFYEHKLKRGDSVSNYLSELQIIVKKLKDLGVEIASETIIAKIVNDLPKEFESFKTSWRLGAVGGLNLSLESLKAQLLVAEKELSKDSTGEGNGELNEALIVKKKGKFIKKKNQRRCYRCGSNDHLIRDCNAGQQKISTITQSKGRNSCGLMVTESSSQKEIGNLQKSFELNHDAWIFDTGASAHMTSQREWLENYEELKSSISFIIGDGRSIQAIGKGRINVKVFNGKSWQRNFMDEVLYVPDLGSHNLFSVGHAISRGHKVEMDGTFARIIDSHGDIVVLAQRSSNELIYRVLMYHEGSELNMSSSSNASYVAKESDLKLWHERLGHVNAECVAKMIKNGILPGAKADGAQVKSFFCEGCAFGKMSKKPSPYSELRSCKPGEFVHCDLVGPMETKSLSGSRFVLVLKDEASSYRSVYFLKHKTEVSEFLQRYIIQVREETGRKIRRLRSDNGTEFVNEKVKKLLTQNGIMHELSAPYTPQQNGFVERENRTLVESARSMIHARNLPKFLWAEALNTACFVLNRVVFMKKDVSPYELWFEKEPSYLELRVFGCEAYKLIPYEHRRKWEPKSKKVIFVGYTNTAKNFRLYDPRTRRVEVSKHVKFNELTNHTQVNSTEEEELQPKVIHKVDLEPMVSQNGPELRDQSNSVLEMSEDSQQTQRAQPNNSETNHDYSDQYSIIYEPIDDNEVEDTSSSNYNLRDRSFLRAPEYFSFVALGEPSSFEEAMKSAQKDKWKAAMDEEMSSLRENKTWIVEENKSHKKPITCRWVFKIKRNPNGSIERYKARLVARGYTQKFGLDYSETFSPVVRFDSIRVILSLAAANKMKIRQFDVKTAFLYGELNEELIMEQPLGYEDGTNRVCKLLKGIYGLKQAPRQWNAKFDSFLKRFGLINCQADQCVYVTNMMSSFTILALYVDDGLLCSTSDEVIQKIEKFLDASFKIRFGDCKCFVGIEIQNMSSGIKIHQNSYIDRLLERFNMVDCKPVLSPGNSHEKLSLEMCPKTELERAQADKLPYQELVGALMFLSSVTRPDIAFDVSRASQFMSNYGELHWRAVKRILRYLKGSANIGIWYQREALELKAYADADYAANPDTRKSTSGFVLTLNGGPITWAARSQKCVAQSTTEAEYIALADCTKDVIWTRQLLSELSRAQTSPTPVYSDNQAAIKLVQNPVYHSRTKHIDVRHHFIRDEREKNTISVSYIPTNSQPADMLQSQQVLQSRCAPQT